MTKTSALLAPEPTPAQNRSSGERIVGAAEEEDLATAIRRPAEILDAAAAAAANGRLGGAKLGLLVAAAGLSDALKAVDAEFARRYEGSPAGHARVQSAPPDDPTHSR